jgi:hypothetical protein
MDFPGGDSYYNQSWYGMYENDFVPGQYAIAVDLYDTDDNVLYTAIAEFTVVAERVLRKWVPYLEQLGAVLNPEGILIETEFPEYPPDIAEIHFSVTNLRPGPIMASYNGFWVLQDIGGEWFVFPYGRGLGTIYDRGVPLLYTGDRRNYTLSVDELRYPFEPGERYAVVLYGGASEEDGNDFYYNVIAEFMITG